MLQSLTISLLRAMPLDMRARVLSEWDKETEIAKTVFLNNSIPDQFSDAYDKCGHPLNPMPQSPSPQPPASFTAVTSLHISANGHRPEAGSFVLGSSNW
jgi:hypothetical protein